MSLRFVPHVLGLLGIAALATAPAEAGGTGFGRAADGPVPAASAADPIVETSPLLIGPIDGLTTDWHLAPDRTSVPAGAEIRFRVLADPDERVIWTGAREIERNAEWSVAACPLVGPGEHAVGVVIAGRETNGFDQCVLSYEPVPVDQISVSAIDVTTRRLRLEQWLTEAEVNERTVEHFFGPSIADVTHLGKDRYLTSVGLHVGMRVEVDPPGFAPLIEWRVNGDPWCIGPVATTIRAEDLELLFGNWGPCGGDPDCPGDVNGDGVVDVVDLLELIGEGLSALDFYQPDVHVVDAGPVDRPSAVTLETYAVSVTSSFANGEVIPEREPVTFHATTDPPGYEDHVRWLASTKYGEATPILGEGPEFTATFRDTYGPHPDGGIWQWIGVKADAARVGQDQKFDNGYAATIGGELDDIVLNYTSTFDGGGLIVGVTASFGEEQGNLWAVRIDDEGGIVWQRPYNAVGFSGDPFEVRQTPDSGFVMAGYIDPNGVGATNFWIVKLLPDGQIEWQENFGGFSSDVGQTIVNTADGGFVVAGEARSIGSGGGDMILLKLDIEGSLQWFRTYGEPLVEERATSLLELPGAGYLLAGVRRSVGVENFDGWLVRVNANGEVIWQKTVTGPGNDLFKHVQLTEDGGFLVSGSTNSYTFQTDTDAWVLKFSAFGGLQWEKTYGTLTDETFNRSLPLDDGGALVSGTTAGSGFGGSDMLLLRLEEDGTIRWQRTFGGPADETGITMDVNALGGVNVVGSTKSFGAGGSDLLVVSLRPDGLVSGACELTGEAAMTVVDRPGRAQNTTIEAAFGGSLFGSFFAVLDTPTSATRATICEN